MDSTDIVTHEVAARLDDLRIVTITDGEVWSARDLMPFAGYTDWRNWSKAIDRAIASVNASGLSGSDHFVGVNRMVELGSGARRQVEDLELTRYACYILFQNADGSKPEIAALQSYFAVQTRKQELAPATVEFDPSKVDRKTLALAVLAAEEEIERQAAEIADLTPRADAWNALASAEGDFSVADAAKTLSRNGTATGQQRLFAFMESINWIFRASDSKWRCYQHAVDKGYLATRAQFHYHPGSGERVVDVPQIRITAKGLGRLSARMNGTHLAVVGS